MNSIAWLFMAIVSAYFCALAATVVRERLGDGGRAGVIAGWCFVPAVLVCPLLIPFENAGLRGASAFVSGELAFRMADFFRQWGRVDRRIRLGEYVRFLVPFPVFLAVYPEHKRRRIVRDNPWRCAARLLGGTVGFLSAVWGAAELSNLALLRSSLVLNHIAMLFTFVIAVESLSRALHGLERLLGFDTRPIIQNAYLSRTAAEFWRRYNYRIHQWLDRNVFQPAGGRQTPIRSVLLTFFVSGIFHEAMFALATSRPTGYQLAFFTIQGPAALASGRLAERGGTTGKILAHAFTILFMGVTSILFFDGLIAIFPFVSARPSPLP